MPCLGCQERREWIVNTASGVVDGIKQLVGWSKPEASSGPAVIAPPHNKGSYERALQEIEAQRRQRR